MREDLAFLATLAHAAKSYGWSLIALDHLCGCLAERSKNAVPMSDEERQLLTSIAMLNRDRPAAALVALDAEACRIIRCRYDPGTQKLSRSFRRSHSRSNARKPQ